MRKNWVLTSRLGRFTFDGKTKLSLAKVIRDAVTGQFFNPKPNEVAVTDEDSAGKFVRAMAGPASDIQFALEIR